MYSQRFIALSERHPEYRPVWQDLASWVDAHPKAKSIDLRRIAKRPEHGFLSPSQFLRIVEILVKEAGFEQKFVVEGPDGTLRGQAYNAIEDIPDTIEGPFGEWFDAKNMGYVVPVLIENRCDVRQR